MRTLEVRRSNGEWYITLDGKFVIGFMGPDAEARAWRELTELSALLDHLNLHTPVLPADSAAPAVEAGTLPIEDGVPRSGPRRGRP